MLPKKVQQFAGGNEEHHIELTHKEHYTIRKSSTSWQGIQGAIQSLRNRRISSSQLKSQIRPYNVNPCICRIHLDRFSSVTAGGLELRSHSSNASSTLSCLASGLMLSESREIPSLVSLSE